MPLEHFEAHLALQIPYPYRLIQTPRDPLASIRRQRNTIHRPRMPLEHFEALSALQIPYPYRLICTPRDPLRPSGVSATPPTSFVCPSSTLRHFPLSRSHTRTVLSVLPEIPLRPSEVSATLSTEMRMPH